MTEESMTPKFRFHVVSLPHTQTTSDYIACAYTQKVVKFCTMMKSLGHEVFLYASEDNEAPCDELITIVTKAEQQQWFGSYDFTKEFFNVDWKPEKDYWTKPNKRAINEIQDRSEPTDFVCLIGGVCQKQIADGLPAMMSVEFGIGYSGVFSKFRVYESYAWMHYVHGLLADDNGHFFDAVIPNYFDPKDFTLKETKEDYYLFIGRLIERKGPAIAAEVTRRIGSKLLMAGQGVDYKHGDKIVAKELTIIGDHIEHVGHADPALRNKLMGGAKAVFVCSTYLEPFGGTSIEPLFCGTPVITTDWGAFPENIIHGEVGYRTRTLGEAIWAAKNLDKLQPPANLRQYAIDNFGLERVAEMYQAYFEQLHELWDEGWYTESSTGVADYQRYTRYPITKK